MLIDQRSEIWKTKALYRTDIWSAINKVVGHETMDDVNKRLRHRTDRNVIWMIYAEMDDAVAVRYDP